MRKYIKGFIAVSLTIALAWCVSGNWFQVMLIQGASMEPAYHNLQPVLLDKCNREYTYGDVVAFECRDLDAVLVKRIAGCPGDVVIIMDGRFYVNGELSPEYKETFFDYSGNLSDEQVLGSDEYIMLGDNLEESKDSRYDDVGPVGEEEIIGKVIE
jgi:signal peptidase I